LHVGATLFNITTRKKGPNDGAQPAAAVAMTDCPASTCVIVNPRAACDVSGIRLETLLEAVGEADIRWTEGPGHAAELAREAISEGASRIVAAGGDGTVSEIASTLAAAPEGAALGILPLGTGNDLARSLGVPLDLQSAARVLREGAERRIDVARVESAGPSFMVIGSTAGLGGDIAAGLDVYLKRAWGAGVYLRMALAEIGSARTYRATIELDDETLELDVTNIVVANARFQGGGIPLAPEARLDDGLLDLVVLPALSTIKLLWLVPLILSGRQLRSRFVIHRRARRVRVAAEAPMPVTIDGEPGGRGPVSYEVEPGALRVICPASRSGR
jgi:diacylglycerol kinase (ATP)